MRAGCSAGDAFASTMLLHVHMQAWPQLCNLPPYTCQQQQLAYGENCMKGARDERSMHMFCTVCGLFRPPV